MQRAGLKSSWKVQFFWDKFKNRYRNADFWYKEFQSIRHDNDLHADKQKIMKLMICICSELYAEKTFDNKPLQEYEKPRVDILDRDVKQGFCCQRKLNKSNERKTFTFWHECANQAFG